MGPATPPGVPIAPGTPGSGGMGPDTWHYHLELLNGGYATRSPAPSLLPAQSLQNWHRDRRGSSGDSDSLDICWASHLINPRLAVLTISSFRSCLKVSVEAICCYSGGEGSELPPCDVGRTGRSLMVQAALHKHLRNSFHFHVEDSSQQCPLSPLGTIPAAGSVCYSHNAGCSSPTNLTGQRYRSYCFFTKLTAGQLCMSALAETGAGAKTKGRGTLAGGSVGGWSCANHCPTQQQEQKAEADMIQQREEWDRKRKRKRKVKLERSWSGNMVQSLGPPAPGPGGETHDDFDTRILEVRNVFDMTAKEGRDQSVSWSLWGMAKEPQVLPLEKPLNRGMLPEKQGTEQFTLCMIRNATKTDTYQDEETTQRPWPLLPPGHHHRLPLAGMEDRCAKVLGSLTCSPHLGLFHELSHQETHQQLAGKRACVVKSKGSAALCPAWPLAEGGLEKGPGARTANGTGRRPASKLVKPRHMQKTQGRERRQSGRAPSQLQEPSPTTQEHAECSSRVKLPDNCSSTQRHLDQKVLTRRTPGADGIILLHQENLRVRTTEGRTAADEIKRKLLPNRVLYVPTSTILIHKVRIARVLHRAAVRRLCPGPSWHLANRHGKKGGCPHLSLQQGHQTSYTVARGCKTKSAKRLGAETCDCLKAGTRTIMTHSYGFLLGLRPGIPTPEASCRPPESTMRTSQVCFMESRNSWDANPRPGTEPPSRKTKASTCSPFSLGSFKADPATLTLYLLLQPQYLWP
ncbi:hypothetical protein QTO34_013551 [Cnephaeus nilssonii]|uniref:Uncharacterized protein n=1 Tax=Cnephaeus nilssonii TaxID=3371016 RepID=A0AA40I994_CNENI|nr:hypothetical protein QTO34_013551 [Eptesicus nilssonii]